MEGDSKKKIIIVSRLLSGKFPEYKDIVPVRFKTTAVAKKHDLADHIKQARVFSGKLNELKLTVDPEGLICFTAQDNNIGEHQSNIKAKVTGEKTILSVNWKYLLDGVSGFKEGEIYMGFNDPLDPILLKPNTQGSFFHIIMPMRGV